MLPFFITKSLKTIARYFNHIGLNRFNLLVAAAVILFIAIGFLLISAFVVTGNILFIFPMVLLIIILFTFDIH